MILRLDPRLPLVWRSPTSAQFGVSRAVVTLATVTTATEHMIAALTSGITRAGLEMIGGTAGASPAEILEFVTAITPALLISRPSTTPHRVLVVGAGPTAQRIVQVLSTSGFDVWVAYDIPAAEAQQCEFAVAVGQFVLDPALHGLWLRRDIPHLGVVIGDSSATIGPVVDPGRTACLYCLQLHTTDNDAAWPAIASQLWGRHSSADTELMASELSAVEARVLAGWFSLDVQNNQQLRLDVASGRVSTTTYAPHPDCGCLAAGLPNASAAAVSASRARAISPVQKGTGSASAGLAVPVLTSPPAPTRG